MLSLCDSALPSRAEDLCSQQNRARKYNLVISAHAGRPGKLNYHIAGPPRGIPGKADHMENLRLKQP